MACLVSGATPDLAGIASHYCVDLDDLAYLYSRGERAWEKLSPIAPNAEAEVSLVGGITKGTADVISISGDIVTIIDWKSGYGEIHHPNQLKSYATAAADQYSLEPHVRIKMIEVWLRHGEMYTLNTTVKELSDFVKKVLRSHEQVGEVYRPGTSCNFCPLAATCQPRKEYIEATCTSLVSGTEQGLGRVSLGVVYSRVQTLKRAIKQYEDLLKSELKHGDIVYDEGNQALSLGQGSRTTIDARIAGPILVNRHGFTVEDLVKCTSLQKGKLLKVVGDRADKSCKASEKRLVMDNIEKAGGISVSYFDKIKHSTGS